MFKVFEMTDFCIRSSTLSRLVLASPVSTMVEPLPLLFIIIISIISIIIITLLSNCKCRAFLTVFPFTIPGTLCFMVAMKLE